MSYHVERQCVKVRQSIAALLQLWSPLLAEIHPLYSRQYVTITTRA